MSPSRQPIRALRTRRFRASVRFGRTAPGPERWRSVLSLLAASLLFFFLGAGEVSAAGVTYDAVSDFSTNGTNPGAVWSYRHADDLVLDGDYALLPTFVADRTLFLPSPPGAPMYYDGTFEGIAKCAAACQLNVSPLVPIDADELWIHPGGDTIDLGLTVIRFTVPTTATYDVQFRFEDIDPSTGGDGVDWYVMRNTSTLASGMVKNSSTGLVNLLSLTLSAGDDINFIISPKVTAFWDSTGLQASVTQRVEANVPIAPWWTLAMLAALAGAYVARRMRKDQLSVR